MEKQLPLNIRTCVDPLLKQYAIAAYTRGTTEERNMALLNCAQANSKAERDQRRANQEALYVRYLDYSRSRSHAHVV